MAKKEYKSASGKRIDFDTLALKGEETIAVGNMGVNARGDKLGEGGEVVKKREEVMADYYRIHNGTIPQERVIPDGSPETALQPDPVEAAKQDPILSELDDENTDDFVTSEQLASALASTAQVVEPVATEKPTVTMPEEDNLNQADEPVKSTPEVEEKAKDEPIAQPRGGLASAVAKVKTSKPVVKEKTAEQEEKAKGGVKRL